MSSVLCFKNGLDFKQKLLSTGSTLSLVYSIVFSKIGPFKLCTTQHRLLLKNVKCLLAPARQNTNIVHSITTWKRKLLSIVMVCKIWYFSIITKHCLVLCCQPCSIYLRLSLFSFMLILLRVLVVVYCHII